MRLSNERLMRRDGASSVCTHDALFLSAAQARQLHRRAKWHRVLGQKVVARSKESTTTQLWLWLYLDHRTLRVKALTGGNET